MTLDPVCLAEVEEHHAGMLGLTSERRGQRLFFCSERCKAEFDRHAASYTGPPFDWKNIYATDNLCQYVE